MNEEIKFSTSGFRAVTAGGLTALNVQRLAHGICSHIFENPYYGFDGDGYRRHLQGKNIKHKRPLVIVGHDTRFMALQFAKVAANVLSANGITVKFAEFPLPTPVAEWAVLKDGAVGAIVITASEAEYYFGGVKWISFYGGIANNEVTQDIESRIPGEGSNALKMSSSDYDYLNSAVNIFNFKKEFLDYLNTALDVKIIKKAKLKIGADPLFGSASNYFRPFLEKNGAQVFGLHEKGDPLFGGKIPNAGPVSLEELSKLVVSKKLDIGIACNPDCDKFGIIDNEGRWVSPNEISALILEHLVKNKCMTGRVCRSVITSHLLDAVAKSHNLIVRETPVGFKYITELMMTGQYVLGAEESGGISVAGHIPDKDGLSTCLVMVEILASEGKKLSQSFKDFYKKYGAFYDKKVSFPKTETQINNILESLDLKAPLTINKTSVWRIDATDGFKFILKDGSWLAVRASGTERLIRLYAESRDAKTPARLIEEGKKIVDDFS